MTATWVALIARSRIISNRQYIPCSLYQTCLVRDNGRPKIKQISIRQVQNNKTTHRGLTCTAQPLGTPSKPSYRVNRPIHQRSRTKFEPTKVSQTWKIKMAHLARAHAAQPHGSPPKRPCKVFGPKRQHGRLKTIPRNISGTETSGNAHQGLYKPIHPLPTRSI